MALVISTSRAVRGSVLQADRVVIRVRAPTVLRGRRLGRHGKFGSLHVVKPADALRMVLAGDAKLPGEFSRRQLQEHCDALLLEARADACTDESTDATGGTET